MTHCKGCKGDELKLTQLTLTSTHVCHLSLGSGGQVEFIRVVKVLLSLASLCRGRV